MNKQKIFDIPIDDLSKKTILEKIKKYLFQPAEFFHIVSLNPENFVIAQENNEFKEVVKKAQIRINDGIGIILSTFLLTGRFFNRVAGVDLMVEMLKLANERRLRVMLLGGRSKVADKVVECQKKKFPKIKFFSLEGIKEIQNPKKEEEEKIFSIVSSFKPHFLFVAFGSPDQEIWLARHQNQLKGVVCMGVGGAFDYLAGLVPRAPKPIRWLGLEWLFRLMIQPWRWKRQLRLIQFTKLIFLNLFVILIDRMFFFSPKTFFEIGSEIIVNLISGWIAILLSPLVLGEFNLNQYLLILTRGLVFSIIGLTISLWLREKAKKI